MAARFGAIRLTDSPRAGRRRDRTFAGGRFRTQAGLAHWLTLIIVLAVSAIAAIAAGYYLRNRSYQQDVQEIEEHVKKAQAASARDLPQALEELQRANLALGRFDASDPKRLELDGRIKQARSKVWEAAVKEMKRLLKEGDLTAAENFYKQAKDIDEGDRLKAMLDSARKEKQLVEELSTGLQDAEALHNDGKMMDALTRISMLYGTIERQKPTTRNGVQKLEDIRTLRDKWIAEGKMQAAQAFEKGNLQEARKWYKFLMDGYVDTGTPIYRDYKQYVVRIDEGRVVGLVVDVKSVRFADKKEVEDKIRAALSKKLDAHGFMPLNLSSTKDSRGSQVGTFLVVDYSEQAGKRVESPDKSRTAAITRIRCVLKILKAGDPRPIDTQIVRTETPEKIALGGHEFTDEFLRDKAADIFFNSVLQTIEPDTEKLQR